MMFEGLWQDEQGNYDPARYTMWYQAQHGNDVQKDKWAQQRAADLAARQQQSGSAARRPAVIDQNSALGQQIANLTSGPVNAARLAAAGAGLPSGYRPNLVRQLTTGSTDNASQQSAPTWLEAILKQFGTRLGQNEQPIARQAAAYLQTQALGNQGAKRATGELTDAQQQRQDYLSTHAGALANRMARGQGAYRASARELGSQIKEGAAAIPRRKK